MSFYHANGRVLCSSDQWRIDACFVRCRNNCKNAQSTFFFCWRGCAKQHGIKRVYPIHLSPPSSITLIQPGPKHLSIFIYNKLHAHRLPFIPCVLTSRLVCPRTLISIRACICSPPRIPYIVLFLFCLPYYRTERKRNMGQSQRYPLWYIIILSMTQMSDCPIPDHFWVLNVKATEHRKRKKSHRKINGHALAHSTDYPHLPWVQRYVC